jgi:serine/threonine protein kinase
MVMEWAPGGTLANLLSSTDGPLYWADPILRLASDVARGMVYLHTREYVDDVDGQLKRSIIHRDLKPANILLTEYNSGKLADFGSSKAQFSDDSAVLHTAVGTPMFVAPEVMRGEKYTELVDVYSFGVLLATMAVPEGKIAAFFHEW